MCHVGLVGLTKAGCEKLKEYRCPGCFVFADGIAVKPADEAAEVDQGDQSEPTLNDLKKGLDELKGIMTTKNMARGGPSEKDCSTLSVMMSDKLHGLSEVIITMVKEEFVKSSEKMQVAVVVALKEKTTSFADYMVKRGNSDIMEGTKQIVTESTI